MRKSLSDKGVAALKPRAARYATPDPELRGHYVRVQPSGTKSFVAVTVDPQSGKQVWHTIGAADAFGIEEARTKARAVIKRVRAGLPPIEAKGETFGLVAANWLRRHVEANGLRSRKNIERLLDSHVLNEWRNRVFLDIRRSDVAALLDDVEDNHSPRQADAVLTVIRSIMNWFASRHDDYTPPIVRGMRRQSPHAQARARILNDDEIRAIWKATETSGSFGGIVRMALLTAQRRAKVAAMRWEDVSIAGEWTIPIEPREKDNAGVLQLPDAALSIIRAQPHMASNAHVFPGRRTDGPFRGFGEGKIALDAKLSADMPGWTLHDLRRTARSLMSRAGVRPDIAERVLGHAIGGVHGTYDRHSYREEKADALKRLAALIKSIVNPAQGNVRPIRKAAR
jgi:integrase